MFRAIISPILRSTRLCLQLVVDSSWNVMAHGDAREGKWRGNWRKECVASTLHTTSEHGVSSITTADAHTSAANSRLNWRPHADLNGLVRFAERLILVSARVPTHFNWPLQYTEEIACWCHQQAIYSVHYTTSCKHSLVLLRVGKIFCRNMLSWLKLLINCYCSI